MRNYRIAVAGILVALGPKGELRVVAFPDHYYNRKKTITVRLCDATRFRFTRTN